MEDVALPGMNRATMQEDDSPGRNQRAWQDYRSGERAVYANRTFINPSGDLSLDLDNPNLTREYVLRRGIEYLIGEFPDDQLFPNLRAMDSRHLAMSLPNILRQTTGWSNETDPFINAARQYIAEMSRREEGLNLQDLTIQFFSATGAEFRSPFHQSFEEKNIANSLSSASSWAAAGSLALYAAGILSLSTPVTAGFSPFLLTSANTLGNISTVSGAMAGIAYLANDKDQEALEEGIGVVFGLVTSPANAEVAEMTMRLGGDFFGNIWAELIRNEDEIATAVKSAAIFGTALGNLFALGVSSITDREDFDWGFKHFEDLINPVAER